MPIIYKSDTHYVRRSEDQYRVYDDDGDRLARLSFSDNGLTGDTVLAILRDLFTQEDSEQNKHIVSCIDSALLALKLGHIKRVQPPMSKFGYCELQVDITSGTKLFNAIVPVAPEGIKFIALNKLHATIMYDARDPEVSPDANNKIYKAKITGVKMLGEPGSKWRSCAIVLDCPAVQERHKELIGLGFEHSYPELLLHVSLVYGQDADVIYPAIQTLFDEGKLPDTLTLCHETWDTCND